MPVTSWNHHWSAWALVKIHPTTWGACGGWVLSLACSKLYDTLAMVDCNLMGMEGARDQDLIYIKHDLIQVLIWHVLIAYVMILSQVNPVLLIDRILTCYVPATLKPWWHPTSWPTSTSVALQRMHASSLRQPKCHMKMPGCPSVLEFLVTSAPSNVQSLMIYESQRFVGCVFLGKVPLLEVDGVQIGQSKAIERFLAT